MKGYKWSLAHLGVTAALLVASLYLIFMWVPTEDTMGIVQRIFYFHVPAAWVAFLAFAVTFAGGLAYLFRRQRGWDNLAYASAEIGVTFATMNLVSGPLWARPVWGIWWTWDARLTSMLALWLIFVAYLLVRAYASPAQAPTFGAVVGIIGFVDVPIVFMAIRWWRGQHPEPVLGGGAESGLDPRMFITLMVSFVAFTLLYLLLLRLRTSLRELEGETETLKFEAGR